MNANVKIAEQLLQTAAVKWESDKFSNDFCYYTSIELKPDSDWDVYEIAKYLRELQPTYTCHGLWFAGKPVTDGLLSAPPLQMVGYYKYSPGIIALCTIWGFGDIKEQPNECEIDGVLYTDLEFIEV